MRIGLLLNLKLKGKKLKVFHNAFKLQGKSFNTVEEILAFSQEISVHVHSFFSEWFDENSFIEVQTSGSTGKPKVIQLQKNNMINSALATGNYFNLPEKTTALLCMSPNFIAGKMMLVRAVILGWHLDVVEAVSNPLKNRDLHYDFSAMVPLQLQNSLADIHKIKKLIIGGGAVSMDLLNEIKQVKTEIFATYGMTETITHIAVKKLNNDTKIMEGETRQSAYRVLPNVSISADERGCLVIEAFEVSQEKITTNDLVNIISETSFEWLGRFDSVINSGGIKLIPEQIEGKLATKIEQRFFVAGISDAVLGEKLILVVESEIKMAEKLKNNMLKKMQQIKNVSKYEIPKDIYFIEKFIETPTRKINRTETLKLLKYND